MDHVCAGHMLACSPLMWRMQTVLTVIRLSVYAGLILLLTLFTLKFTEASLPVVQHERCMTFQATTRDGRVSC